MTKKASLYARALVQSLEGASEQKQKEIISRFKSLLKKRGDLRHLSSVFQEFEKLWEERDGKIARVVSHAGLSVSFAGLIKGALKEKGYQIKEEQDKSLIGGVAVFLGNEYLFDNTVKGKLQKLKAVLRF